MPLTFKKTERLHRKKDIQELFDNGSSFFLYPFKILYLQNPDEASKCHQWMISVSKKYHKTAVARNKIKRRTREAWRLHRSTLRTESGNNYFIAYIYVSDEILPYAEIENKLIQSIRRLSKIM